MFSFSMPRRFFRKRRILYAFMLATTLWLYNTSSVKQETHAAYQNTLSRDELLPPRAGMLYNLTTDVDFDRKIDMLQSPPIPFLPNFKNPCWYEPLPTNLAYQKNPYTAVFSSLKKELFGQVLSVFLQRQRSGFGWRLRCLPYFYLPGVAKSGTTDIYHALSMHPEVAKGATKEPIFWNRVRYNGTSQLKTSTCDRLLASVKLQPSPRRFSYYVDLFDGAAERIRTSVKHQTVASGDVKNYHPLITGDASSNYMYDFDEWTRLDVNKGLSEPTVIIADLIHRLNPNARIIFSLRDPTERLFSAYKYFGVGRNITMSTDDFHSLAAEEISNMEKCLSQRSVRSCIYDKNLSSRPVKVREGMYQPFMSDWFKVFPKEHIFVTRFEDYRNNRTKVLLAMYEFLGLAPFVLPKDIPIQNGGKVLPGFENGMREDTRMLLNQFYRKWNHKLAAMLGDERFTWGC